MPPTTGHGDLIDFAARFGPLRVVLTTQPHEPDVLGRQFAVDDRVRKHGGHLFLHDEAVEQNPDTAGFRQMWGDKFRSYGFQPGDYLVTSETYGEWLAEILGGVWVPYDIQRTLNPVKATRLRATRHSILNQWHNLLPEYKFYQQKRVTFFGAESVGKTTGAKRLASFAGSNEAKFLPEWARPYLEAVGPEVTNEKMEIIFKGQTAIQRAARLNPEHAIIAQDTDLFSTIGYWRVYDPEYYNTGTRAEVFEFMATRLKSDLYVVCPSDIPFEADQLRYGGDKRETPDQYWINLLEEFNLDYIVWDRNIPNLYNQIREMFPDMRYDRQGY